MPGPLAGRLWRLLPQARAQRSGGGVPDALERLFRWSAKAAKGRLGDAAAVAAVRDALRWSLRRGDLEAAYFAVHPGAGATGTVGRRSVASGPRRFPLPCPPWTLEAMAVAGAVPAARMRRSVLRPLLQLLVLCVGADPEEREAAYGVAQYALVDPAAQWQSFSRGRWR